MKKIFKYLLKNIDKQTVSLHQGSKILSVDEQYGEIIMYALINPDKPIAMREVRIYGTGCGMEDKNIEDKEFVGTVKLLDGNLMFHVFVSEE